MNSPAPRPKRRRFSRTLTIHFGIEILKIFIIVFLVLQVIHGTVFVIKVNRDLGLDLVLLLPIFGSTFAYSLYHSIPIAMLCATGLVFGKLLAEREVAAMKSFGISYFEMLLAPMILGLALATGGYFINGYLVPHTRHVKNNLGKMILEQLQYLEDGDNKAFPLDSERENYLLFEKIRNGRIYDAYLVARRPERIFGFMGRPGDEEELDGQSGVPIIESRSFPLVVSAREGEIGRIEEGGVVKTFLVLSDVRTYFDDDFYTSAGGSDFLQTARISTFSVPLDFETERKQRIKDMMLPELHSFIAQKNFEYRLLGLEFKLKPEFSPPAWSPVVNKAERKARKEYRKARTVYQRILTYSAISFTFPILVALLALTLNSANRLLPFFVGTVVCCGIFFPLEMRGYSLGESMDMPFMEHLGNAALLLLSLFLWLRLDRFGLRSLRRRRRTG